MAMAANWVHCKYAVIFAADQRLEEIGAIGGTAPEKQKLVKMKMSETGSFIA